MTTSPLRSVGKPKGQKMDPEPNALSPESNALSHWVGGTTVRETMQTPREYREGARHCRELLDHPLEREVRIQLRLWAAELDDMAAAIECGAEASARKEFARPL